MCSTPLVFVCVAFVFLGLSSVVPILPGAGLVAGIIGGITKDRPLSFIAGLCPYLIAIVLFLIRTFVILDGDFNGFTLLVLLAGGIGMGMVGLAGSI